MTIDTTKVKKILYISNFIANIFQQRKKMCAISAKYSNDFSNFAEKCAMANNNIKYQFALDEDGNLISINDITQENRKQHTHKCIACGNELLPRAIGSQAMSPHFYHK